MHLGEGGGIAVRFAVEDEVDLALAIQGDVLERWRATAVKPISSSTAAMPAGSAAVYSTNSKPSVPMGLSNRSPLVLWVLPGLLVAAAVANWLSAWPSGVSSWGGPASAAHARSLLRQDCNL
jgi:hypothetical protein